MKKIVAESLNDFRSQSINEGILDKVSDFFKKVLQKAKGIFVTIMDGTIFPVVPPVNIGILVKRKDPNINPWIGFVASPLDIELEPSLVSLTKETLLKKIQDMRDSYPQIYGKPKGINEAAPTPFEFLEYEKGKNVPNIGKQDLLSEIRMVLNSPPYFPGESERETPLMVWGAPGIGKTAIVKEVLGLLRPGARLIQVPVAMMSPEDFGLPALDKEENPETGDIELVATDLVKAWIPAYKKTRDPEKNRKLDAIANGEDGGLIFFDEMSRASRGVQNACLKIIDERVIGEYVIGSKWVIISASNRREDDPDLDQVFSTALGNRFNQVNYVPSFKDWKEWAIGKVDKRILDFLEFNQDLFYTLSVESGEPSHIFASPRTWESASRNIAKKLEDAHKYGYTPTLKDYALQVGKAVGTNIAEQFTAFLRVLETFSIEDIELVMKNPDKAKLPRKAGKGYEQSEANAFLSLVISRSLGKTLTKEEYDNFMKYLIRLDNPSLAARALKLLFEYHPYAHEEIGDTPEAGTLYKEGTDMYIDHYGDFLKGA